MRTLVLGVGNPLMSDDGVGQRLLVELASLPPPLAGVDYVDAGTLSFLLLPRIEDCTALLVLDAARLGGAPGEVREFSGASMDDVANQVQKKARIGPELIKYIAKTKITA